MSEKVTMDDLESAVLARIGAWRVRQARPFPPIPAGALVVTIALLAGLVLGWSQAHRGAALPVSESIVVADDAGLPSMLLANN